jgi:transcriptional regulator with XRE-family HTH domain
MEITPEQIRAARALLRLGQAELAEKAHVSVVTIRRLEGPTGLDRVSRPSLDGIRKALEQAGAEFIPFGVRRRIADSPGDASLFEDLRAISLRGAERLRGQNLLTDADLYNEDGLPA